jgi:hypothetical protein
MGVSFLNTKNKKNQTNKKKNKKNKRRGQGRKEERCLIGQKSYFHWVPELPETASVGK